MLTEIFNEELLTSAQIKKPHLRGQYSADLCHLIAVFSDNQITTEQAISTYSFGRPFERRRLHRNPGRHFFTENGLSFFSLCTNQRWVNCEKKMNDSNQTSVSSQFCGADTSSVTQVIEVSLYVIVMLVSLIGNALIFAVVFKNRRMRTPVNFFVVNMSAADILITVFYMPRMISRIFLGSEWGISGGLGHFLCKIGPFTQELSASVSVLTLILMAVDRFFAVLFPLKRVFTNTVAYTSIAVVWLTAMAVRSPMFYGLHFIQREDGKTFCVLRLDSEVAFNVYLKFAFVLFYVIPLFLIVVLYSAVLVSLKKRKPVGVDLTNIQRKYKDRLKRTRKVMNMLFTIVFVFAVCWCLHFFLPILSVRFGARVCKLIFPAFFLGHASSAVNPCIYLIYIENYRRGFCAILNPLYRRCFARVTSNSRVMPQDCSDVMGRRKDSNNLSLTLGTLDYERTVRPRAIEPLSVVGT